MDVVHQDALVLEDVTLALHVEVVVEMAVDLALLAVLAEESSEDSLSPHPEDLGGHAGLGGTLSLTGTGVTTLCFGELHVTGTGSGAVGWCGKARMSVLCSPMQSAPDAA